MYGMKQWIGSGGSCLCIGGALCSELYEAIGFGNLGFELGLFFGEGIVERVDFGLGGGDVGTSISFHDKLLLGVFV